MKKVKVIQIVLLSFWGWLILYILFSEKYGVINESQGCYEAVQLDILADEVEIITKNKFPECPKNGSFESYFRIYKNDKKQVVRIEYRRHGEIEDATIFLYELCFQDERALVFFYQKNKLDHVTRVEDSGVHGYPPEIYLRESDVTTDIIKLANYNKFIERFFYNKEKKCYS